jgi:hypothetical protein
VSRQKRGYKTREQEAEQMRQRRANEEAAARGDPLPYLNFFFLLDSTKLPEDASDEEIAARYREFCKLCPPRARKEYTI